MNKKLKMQFITFKKLPLLPFLEGLSDLAFDVIPKDSTGFYTHFTDISKKVDNDRGGVLCKEESIHKNLNVKQ